MVGTVHKSYHIGAVCVCWPWEVGLGHTMLSWGLRKPFSLTGFKVFLGSRKD